MSFTPRWIAPLAAEAARRRVRLPWERGLRRQAFIARRAAAPPVVPPTALRRLGLCALPHAVLKAS